MGPVYCVFDGDSDKWAYGFMKGWKTNNRVDFDFVDAHDLDNMTGRAQDEAYVKSNLKQRMLKSDAVLVIVGDNTKLLRKYVPWELELAMDLGLPIIVTNLNDKNGQDDKLCPVPIRNECVVHVPFKRAAIKHALDHWPSEFHRLNAEQRKGGWRYYKDVPQ